MASTRSTGRTTVVSLVIIFATAAAGCSGGGFLPFGDGPHSIAPAILNSIISEQSAEHGVSPDLVRAVIHQESGEDPSAISSAGAMGLMQLMPGTADAYGVNDPFDPEQNVAGGTALLADLLRQYHGNVRLALAAYNAGSGAVAKYHGIPPFAETQAYVRDVTSLYRASTSHP
ncbi:MAG TPA: lytic transglycosylase domain-containing protein [Candidatus Eremiobacteraceae bacterium]|nr:lytic transglycosylase domain-containing protein [Candidatus Eremiobacteraceae bacterium]